VQNRIGLNGEKVEEDSREIKIRICNRCYKLESGVCNNTDCVFIRKTKAEVAKLMDTLLIRPNIDGEILDLYPIKDTKKKVKNA